MKKGEEWVLAGTRNRLLHASREVPQHGSLAHRVNPQLVPFAPPSSSQLLLSQYPYFLLYLYYVGYILKEFDSLMTYRRQSVVCLAWCTGKHWSHE